MHARLKQRLLYYVVTLMLVFFVGKLLYVSHECREQFGVSRHQHVVGDTWNLNEHQIESNIATEIERMKRNNGKLFHGGGRNGNKEGILDHIRNSLTTADDWGPHTLGIIVPFRNRFEEMKEFVPHMQKYLNEKKIRHKIYIINQVDSHRFNRASLINIGFTIARAENCDYIAMHDVDLLPLNKQLNYGYPELGPFHVSGPDLHPKYHYKKFVGGILILSVEQFETLNGLSNKFWGWGREDDEFYMRIVEAGYKIYRHGAEITTGYNTFKHEHSVERKRDYKQLPGQRKAMFSRDHDTGLSTLEYKQKTRNELLIDGARCSVVDVELTCDLDNTPWCDLPKSGKKTH